MNRTMLCLVAAAAIFSSGCSRIKNSDKPEGPAKVELRNLNGKSRLFVNGKEFFVNGGGCEFGNIEALANHGGNSIRTWRVENGQRSGKEVLDDAYKNGVMVMMGIDVARERHGFDYSDSLAVAAQLDSIRKDVIALKDHPALLGWGIGNELNLHYTNKKVWDAVQDIAAMIHEIDGNHPATTMLAGIGKGEVDYIAANCPDIDFLCIQMYGDIVNLPQRLTDAGYNGPYLVSEWGATGHWEVKTTEWKAPIEQTSTEKAAAIKERYEKAILADSVNCMGSFVFLWGQKQERTPTWYGLFTENDEETEAIDLMHYYWNGKWPANRCPTILNASLDGKSRFDNISLKPGKDYEAFVEASDPDNDTLSIRAEILHESTDLKDGGDVESRPEDLNELIHLVGNSSVTFKSPVNEGYYRLFIYVLDGKNHAATINFPFMVKK